MSFILRVSHAARGFASAAAQSNLAVLRKNTGYSFSLCKKALSENNNDLVAAEQWLNKQAENLEWSKNKNVTARKTNQGLIGLWINKTSGAMIELNCETDFVARNENFLSLLHTSAQSCTEFVERTVQAGEGESTKLILDVEELKRAPVTGTGKPLQEHINQAIETIKENITFGRAIGFRVAPGVLLHGCTHPFATIHDSVSYGRYGALIALKSHAGSASSLGDVPKNLCQHIVGMNPKRIGKVGVDEASADSENEECLIHQEFVLDPSVTVGELLQVNQIELLDFHRFGCDDAKEEAASS